MIAVMRLPITM